MSATILEVARSGARYFIGMECGAVGGGALFLRVTWTFFISTRFSLLTCFHFGTTPCIVWSTPAPASIADEFFHKTEYQAHVQSDAGAIGRCACRRLVALASAMNKLEKMFYDETGADVSFYRIGMEGGGPFSIMHDGRAALAVMCICEIVTHCFAHA